ncbi:hypothetical protein L2E82_01739 [Cichorium intybus]|uniref:Uncharacterized protein n=1 Tax=Cichorium intybus TaxID=13427 RepID=A0ACB9H0W3_CICIN|nr:hypothetical protein L2E82_01739 [Cichorium intybus]
MIYLSGLGLQGRRDKSVSNRLIRLNPRTVVKTFSSVKRKNGNSKSKSQSVDEDMGEIGDSDDDLWSIDSDPPVPIAPRVAPLAPINSSMSIDVSPKPCITPVTSNPSDDGTPQVVDCNPGISDVDFPPLGCPVVTHFSVHSIPNSSTSLLGPPPVVCKRLERTIFSPSIVQQIPAYSLYYKLSFHLRFPQITETANRMQESHQFRWSEAAEGCSGGFIS